MLISAHVKAGGALAVIMNSSEEERTVTVRVDLAAVGIVPGRMAVHEILTQEEVQVRDGAWTVTLPPLNMTMVMIQGQ